MQVCVSYSAYSCWFFMFDVDSFYSRASIYYLVFKVSTGELILFQVVPRVATLCVLVMFVICLLCMLYG
jgi:hypothetical protein